MRDWPMTEFDAELGLIRAAAGGDMAALEQLLWSHYSALERHIEPQIPADARKHFNVEDILQTTFSQAFRDISRFEPRGSGAFFAWLRTIADHRLVDALRKMRRGSANQLSINQAGSLNSLTDLLDIVCHDSASASRNVSKDEALRALQIAIAGLPEDQQQVLRLNCLEEKSIAEVAAETGRTEAAVRGLIFRGKKNLAEAMGRSSRWLSSR
jgi:RNA polymerase sigma-70 factor, ECF subfamily